MKPIFLAVTIAIACAGTTLAQTKTQAATTAAAATTSAADLLADAKRAIDKGNAQWSEGWAKGDASLIAAIFTEDGVQLGSNGKMIKGRAQIQAVQKERMASVDPGTKVSVVTADVWVDGDTAYETGKYKYEYTDKGKPGTLEGRYVTVWKHQKDGTWKLTVDMGVPD